MTQETKNRFFEIAFKNEATAKDLLGKTPEEVSAYMAAQGIECTAEEVKAIGDELLEKVNAIKNGELSEDDLADVAGGNKYTYWGGVATGVLIGGIIICGW